nr:RNA-directed DNA polymerase, eukaryota, reverse transcriptase zinc-binding domain protein [Tanacetum cinerariifolium]
MVDGVWIEQPTDVKREFFNHFRDRFDKSKDERITIEMMFPRHISNDQQVELERDLTKEELKLAVWDCGTDKSPGPDGFTFGFYHHFWSLIEQDVFDAVNHFFIHGDIPKGGNPSLITLIPKVPAANLVKDFRPTCLIGSVYKIIAKILANRLIGVLDNIVHEGLNLSNVLCLSHMFYADDAVFVGQWSDENINTLINVLDCFHRASGLKINMSKSKLFSVNVEGNKVKQAASKLGCLTLSCPFSYLGTK